MGHRANRGFAAGRSADAARQQIEALLSHAATGLHLVHPWQVVVAGRPNVGKSSLINAIAGYRRAIVHSTPGTTRDVVSVQTAMDGWPVEISDTAGLRETGDKSSRRASTWPGEDSAADLIVLVFDNSLPWSRRTRYCSIRTPQPCGYTTRATCPACLGQRPPGLELSAMQSAGIDVLCQAIADRSGARSTSARRRGAV